MVLHLSTAQGLFRDNLRIAAFRKLEQGKAQSVHKSTVGKDRWTVGLRLHSQCQIGTGAKVGHDKRIRLQKLGHSGGQVRRQSGHCQSGLVIHKLALRKDKRIRVCEIIRNRIGILEPLERPISRTKQVGRHARNNHGLSSQDVVGVALKHDRLDIVLHGTHESGSLLCLQSLRRHRNLGQCFRQVGTFVTVGRLKMSQIEIQKVGQGLRIIGLGHNQRSKILERIQHGRVRLRRRRINGLRFLKVGKIKVQIGKQGQHRRHKLLSRRSRHGLEVLGTKSQARFDVLKPCRLHRGCIDLGKRCCNRIRSNRSRIVGSRLRLGGLRRQNSSSGILNLTRNQKAIVIGFACIDLAKL